MKKTIVLLLCFSLICSQSFAGGNVEKAEIDGGLVGVIAGSAAGAAIGSGVPVFGTIIGGVIGGGVGFAGGKAIKAMADAYDYDPIFDVRTKIKYCLLEGDHLLLYPTPSNDSELTIVGNQISVKINMTPLRICEDKSVEETDVMIPVIIQIVKSGNVNPTVTCEYVEGLSNLTNVESDLEGTFYYGKLDAVEKTNNIMFKIESEEGSCSIQFNVFYGVSGNKVIVSEDSNTVSTFNLTFIDREQLRQ